MAKLANDTSFEQKYISKDLALLEDVVFAAPYDLDVEYPLDDSYEVLFEEQCSVRVNRKGTPIYSGSLSFCAADIGLEVNYPDMISSESILFEKKGNIFEVSEGE